MLKRVLNIEFNTFNLGKTGEKMWLLNPTNLCSLFSISSVKENRIYIFSLYPEIIELVSSNQNTFSNRKPGWNENCRKNPIDKVQINIF